MLTGTAWQSTPYVFLLFVAATSAFLWALYGVQRVHSEGWRAHVAAFVVLCFAVAVWAGGYAIQLASPTLEGKLLAYKLLHVGAVVVPPAWLAFALAYSGREAWLTKPTLAGLLVVPVALLAALPANQYSLALADVSVRTVGSLHVLATESGPLYSLFLAYSYVLILAGVAFIVAHAVRAAAALRRQSILLVASAFIPLGLSVFEIAELPPFGTVAVNLTPVSLALSTVCFGVALFRYRLLDVIPVAWDVVLEQLSDGVVVLNNDERVVDLNPAAEAVVGSAHHVLGEPASTALPDYDRLKAETPFRVTLDGDRIVQLARSPLTARGVSYGWVILIQDVTAAERYQQKLERQNTRLDEFARVVAHDLRTPLTIIDGYAELAAETGEKQHLETIHDTVDRMNDFLEELLVLFQQGRTVTVPAPVSLAVVAQTARTGIDGDLDLVIRTDAVVMADENRLEQVFANLFRNARDHNDTDHFTVTVGDLTDGSGFFVEDDGSGIPVAKREAVFDVGVSTRSGGSGFGLTIVRDIANAHGWSVAVTEGEAGGARFEFTGVDVVDAE